MTSRRTHDRRSDKQKRLRDLASVEPGTLGFYAGQWVELLRVRNYMASSLRHRERQLRYFVVWCAERGLTKPGEITVGVAERYQRALFYAKKESGAPLSARSQNDRLATVRGWFRWLARTRVIETSPCETLELPRIEQRLPKAILTIEEMERILAVPDISTPMGLRDRAILETLYSTGIRRAEICALQVRDLDLERGTLMVRQGKGRKDRMIPVGERAVLWIAKYLDEVRPALVRGAVEGAVFLTRNSCGFAPIGMSVLVKAAVDQAQIGKQGSCHLFRHTMATHMLEGGADIRFIQAMLGHASIHTTEIYTQVAIHKLKEVHERTHPGSKLAPRSSDARAEDAVREELLAALDADAAEELETRATELDPPKRRSSWFLRT